MKYLSKTCVCNTADMNALFMDGSVCLSPCVSIAAVVLLGELQSQRSSGQPLLPSVLCVSHMLPVCISPARKTGPWTLRLHRYLIFKDFMFVFDLFSMVIEVHTGVTWFFWLVFHSLSSKVTVTSSFTYVQSWAPISSWRQCWQTWRLAKSGWCPTPLYLPFWVPWGLSQWVSCSTWASSASLAPVYHEHLAKALRPLAVPTLIRSNKLSWPLHTSLCTFPDDFTKISLAHFHWYKSL